MEFFIPESPATEILRNFSSWNLWQQKFRGIFHPAISGAKIFDLRRLMFSALIHFFV
jgi:hypothetical protein